jgi:FkbM family methyltransferase
MLTCRTLEETLGGGWKGLHHEVVVEDCYRLRTLDFVPDVVFDIGANVGTFTRHARSLFPNAYIVAVEPDPENAVHWRKFTPDDVRVVLWQEAIGEGQIYRGVTARNGSGETYLSAGLGYPAELIEKQMDLTPVPVPSARLSSFAFYAKGQTLMKIDCEGAENFIFDHEPSRAFLHTIDYIAMEIHFYAINGSEYSKMQETILSGLCDLANTHDCHFEGVHFWARKRSC